MFRKMFNLVLALAMLLILASAASAAPSAQEGMTYTVKPGDNLWTLAKKYLGSGPAYEDIVSATNVKHAQDDSFVYIGTAGLIQPGWKLLIPGTSAAPAATTGSQAEETHWERLEELDFVFRTQGWQAWLEEAGLTWDSIKADARQIEEETSPAGRILAAGLQVNTVNLWVPWPNIVTTSEPNRITEGTETRKHQPDPDNPSVLYTNVIANGEITVWVDGSNWEQLRPTTPTPTLGCPTTPADLTDWGTVLQQLYDGDGKLAGAQLGDLTAAKIQQLKDCGLVVQGDSPTIRSIWLW